MHVLGRSAIVRGTVVVKIAQDLTSTSIAIAGFTTWTGLFMPHPGRHRPPPQYSPTGTAR